MANYNIVLADNHLPFREGLRRIVDEQPDLAIVGEAGEGRDLLNLMGSIKEGPLMVILDLSLPNLPWTQVIRSIKTSREGTNVLILSMHEDVEYLNQALAAGAEGYLIKEHVAGELLRAIETIREGSVYIPQALKGER